MSLQIFCLVQNHELVSHVISFNKNVQAKSFLQDEMMDFSNGPNWITAARASGLLLGESRGVFSKHVSTFPVCTNIQRLSKIMPR